MATDPIPVQANLPPAGECRVLADDRALLEFVRNALYVLLPTSSEVTFSFGPTPPEGVAGRATALHIETNQLGVPVAIQVFASGSWKDFYRQVVGSLQWFPVGGAPTGWWPANGNAGTPNLSEETYYEPVSGIILHQFRGNL